MFTRFPAVLAAAAALLLAVRAAAQPSTLDDFEALEQWKVIASDGVRASIAPVDGPEGRALRLDYDFHAGAGYCIIRRNLDLQLPDDFRFTLRLRAQDGSGGPAPANNLEFKLVDPTGDNVWWVNQRAYEFPAEWRTLKFRRRHFQFAWGPAGPGAPLARLGAIEFAIAAAEGGKGSVYFDTLTLEPMAPGSGPPEPPTITVSSGRVSAAAPDPELAPGPVNWQPDNTDRAPWLEVAFQHPREIGGVVLDWAAAAPSHGFDYDVLTSDDGRQWDTLARIRSSNGGRDWIPTPDAEAGRLRIAPLSVADNAAPPLHSLRIQPPSFAPTPNALFRAIARELPRGSLPRPFLDEQEYWTIVGAPGDDKEALLSADGRIEIDRRGFSIEPCILLHSDPQARRLTWADVSASQQLERGDLPIPSVLWKSEACTLKITALADGPAGRSELLARYLLTNTSDRPLRGSLALAIRPFQVLPPWQELNLTGGVSPIGRIRFNSAGLAVVNEEHTVNSWNTPSASGAATWSQGEIFEQLARGQFPTDSDAADPFRLASGAMRFDFDLAPGQTTTTVLRVPFHAADSLAAPGAPTDPAAAFETRLRAAADQWDALVSRVRLKLPAGAAALAESFRATQAYILINRDGAAIQPGSRTYERSWIRDGSMTSAALLATGHADEAKAFVDWFAQRQYDNGKIPCVVDSRGPDPVPEHDSTGQYIYAVATVFRFTHDRAFLDRHLPRVVKAVEFIESLRAQRLTPEYAPGTGSAAPPLEKQACYGLVPESISHEGYSAKPMHSYWDSFFVLRGLKDATYIAEQSGRTDLQDRFGTLRDQYRAAMYDSMRLAMRLKGIDYVPGCVELGDFDATSTAVGIFPAGELGLAPEPQFSHTFDRYFEFFTRRASGQVDWKDYTPYEVRLIGSFVRLGQPARAHALLAFFLHDQRPAAWRQWAEIVWKEPLAPRFIGDMPHTWVGGDFVSAVRSMFVYEDERAGSLVLGAGIRPDWLDDPAGVSIADFPTEYGPISYEAVRSGNQVTISLHSPAEAERATAPPGGIVLRIPFDRAVASATLDGNPVATQGARPITIPRASGRLVVRLAE